MRIASFNDLFFINVHENNQPFVDANSFDPSIKFGYEYSCLPINGDKILVREQVARKLAKVNKEIQGVNPSFTLCVACGYRSLVTQKILFQKELDKLDGELSDEQKKEVVHNTKIALPEVASHPTGGAVDITIYNLSSSSLLDMGGKIADFCSDCQTFSKNLTLAQKKNRFLLHRILTKQKFAPFYNEWWHFSFGDKEWAWFYKKPFAIYEQKEIIF